MVTANTKQARPAEPGGALAEVTCPEATGKGLWLCPQDRLCAPGGGTGSGTFGAGPWVPGAVLLSGPERGRST